MLRSKLLVLALTLGTQACQFEVDEFWYKDVKDIPFEQVDRIGQPYLKELFTDNELKKKISLGSPETDAEQLASLISAEVARLRQTFDGTDFPVIDANALTPDEVAAKLVPNVLVVKFTESIAIKNGNGFSVQGDDGFDVMLRLVLGRSELSDAVSRNPSVNKFPYIEN